METIPPKKRRGRKPNPLKYLTGKLPERDKRNHVLKNPNHHKNKKNKSSKNRRKSKVSPSRYAEKEGYEAEVQVLESSISSGPATGNVYREVTALASNKQELKSSDRSEMSLLSDITIDSIMDRSGPLVVNAHSTPKTVPSPSLFQDSPQAHKLESYLLSPELTPNTSICCDHAQPFDFEQTSTYTAHTDEITEHEDGTHSKDACGSDLTPICNESCEYTSFTECEDVLLPPSMPDTSDSDLWLSKENFKTVGLTNINLEELVDTSSVILSVDNTVGKKCQKRREECKDFEKVMKGDNKNKKLQRNYKKSLISYNLVSFNADLVARELDFITDFVYCKYECPALIQKFLQYNYWENRLLSSAGATPPKSCSSNGSKEGMYHKQRRAQLARELAGCSSQSKPLQGRPCIDDNPPVEEISRTPKPHYAARSQSSPRTKEHPFNNMQDHRNIRIVQDRAINKDKEKNGGRLNVFKRLNSYDWDKMDSDETDEFQDIEVGDKEDKKWLTLSEWWLSKALDVNEMLELLD